MPRYLVLILSLCFCSASHAVTKSTVPPNQYSYVPSGVLISGLWEWIDRNSFSNALEAQVREEYREQVKALMDNVYIVTSKYVLHSSNVNLENLITASIIENIPTSFADLCSIEASTHILAKATARFEGASLAAKVASRRASKKSDLMNTEREGRTGSVSSGYSLQYYIDFGAAWGQADGKFITYLDEKYIHLASDYIFNQARAALASIEVAVAKHCAQSEPQIFLKKTSKQIAKQEDSEVFLVNLPAHKSTTKIPFRTEDTTSVVVATYDKNSDAYVIKRDQLVKIGLIPGPIKLNLSLPKKLDPDLMLIGPAPAVPRP